MTNIAQQLIEGSATLNRMTKEIELVVKMINGMLRADDIVAWKADKIPGRFGRLSQVFRFDDCEWIIYLTYSTSFDVECQLLSEVGYPHDPDSRAFSTKRYGGIHLTDVKKVYDSLPFFVEKMAETFPRLRIAWQPLLDAASL